MQFSCTYQGGFLYIWIPQLGVEPSPDKYSFSYNSNVPDLKVSHHCQSMEITITRAVAQL